MYIEIRDQGLGLRYHLRFVDWIIQSRDIGQESLTRPGMKSIKYICKAQTPSYLGYSGFSEYVTFMKIGCYLTFAFSFFY